MRHRTLIAEDEPLASEALAAWVNEMPMLELVGCRGDGASALKAIRELAPALVLMDIHMPGMTGSLAPLMKNMNTSRADDDVAAASTRGKPGASPPARHRRARSAQSASAAGG